MFKMKALAAGVLGFAFLCAGAAPAFAATHGPEQGLNAAQHGVVNTAGQIAPVVAPVVAPLVQPNVAVVKPAVEPVVAPVLVLAPDVHPTVNLPGAH
jgi:hypothetical protein